MLPLLLFQLVLFQFKIVILITTYIKKEILSLIFKGPDHFYDDF
jgi:hypothetical protein